MPEQELYGIRLLAKQFLGTVLDIEVDHWTSLNSSPVSSHSMRVDVTSVLSSPV